MHDSDNPDQFYFRCPPKFSNHIYWHWIHTEFMKRICWRLAADWLKRNDMNSLFRSLRVTTYRETLCLKLKWKQECIPVECVPPACWPYPSMHWAGFFFPACTGQGGACLGQVCLRVSAWGVSAQGVVCPGSVCPEGCVSAKGLGVWQTHSPRPEADTPLWTEWQTGVKHYLAATSLRAVIMCNWRLLYTITLEINGKHYKWKPNENQIFCDLFSNKVYSKIPESI